jgi:tetratricopeptide (TPR) repeat protein
MGECNENTIDRGIHYFDEALKIDPDYAAAWCYKGMLLNYSGRDYEADIALNKALDLYNKEIDKHPGNSRAWEEKGWALKSLGRTIKANIALEKVKELRA